MTQNSTPKRMKEYRSRLHDADNMERTQQALTALAELIEANKPLGIFESIKTKRDVEPLVYKGLTGGGGYYDVIVDKEYSDKSPIGLALQHLLEESLSPAKRFDRSERQRRERITQMEDKLRFADVPGFFPTPRHTIDRMLQLAEIAPRMRILEPSAGIGSIADAIMEHCPTAELLCVELRHSLYEILQAKEHTAILNDFLEIRADGIGERFDRIVMNPPFERGQDAEHIMHAYSLLKTGGRLVAICSSGLFFRTDSKTCAFQDWLATTKHTEEALPDNWCMGGGAFRTTGVNAKLLVVEKP